jgi:acetylornithine deacetylase/succinyl-diaminopimelate desuccinylase-like protein
MNPVFNLIDSNRENAVEALKKLAGQPSVAATGEGVRNCANLVKEMLEQIGGDPRVYDIGEGSPVIAGEIKSKKNPRKTVLFYNHYDVQPAEPLELWESPPFTPTIKNGKMYGRGVADDKAELTGRLKLTEAFLKATGDVPCNFKFLFEGEEEIGSVHLAEYARKYPGIFKADAVIWEFGGVDPEERPIITLGVKGILYVQLTATNANTDAHSSLGAIVENPAWRLVGALNTLKRNEHILIPGWYDDVRPFTKKELKLIEAAPYEAAALKKELGIKRFIKDMDVLEAKKALAGKPTCTICGLNSGYTGVGSKTVLPREAFAKVDFRLVPDQDPDILVRKLKTHLDRGGYQDIKITYAEGERAKRTLPDEPIAVSAQDAAREVYERKPVVEVSSAGTGPMSIFEAPCISIGGGYSLSKAHAPNENARLDLFVKGMKWVAGTVERFANLRRP